MGFSVTSQDSFGLTVSMKRASLGRKMSFHVKRRRWIEVETGKSVSRRWDLVAEGTRFSKEFAAFLKDMLGQIPDYGPLS